ncbi:winged helix-turn-helix domain-containing protein [Vibrio coralliilyticus]|uniref:winged helix-turn-helix domain-containing protein n=1 Tax=Vibrio coralliilyticus TaxID=190893 RepID=UPI00155F67AF|nr:winged helix-turn-helix domain-containing protein [Vibrio coralliilyticus]NRF12904.1 winged helix-turn-helix domain-containing protein [Vibrio coralliilyticus]
MDTSDLSITNSTTGKLIRLRPLPFKVLIYLYENKGKCITRNELFSECWNGAIVSDQALTNVISNLRKSLLEVNAYNVILKTVSKVGYILEHRDADSCYQSEKGQEIKIKDNCIEGIRSSEDDNEQKKVLKSSKIRHLKEKIWRMIFIFAISIVTFTSLITPPPANTDNPTNNEFEIL